MIKHNYQIMLFLCILLLIIPVSFASDNNTDATDAVSLDSDSSNLGTAYYYNASSESNGNGSEESPYNTLTSSNVVDNSELYLANGEYSLKFSKSFSNISFYGQDASKTIINGYGYRLTSTSVLVLKNITLYNFEILNSGTVTATNTIFSSSSGKITDSYGNSYGGAVYSTGNLNFDNCTFMKNYALYGGAIYISGATLTITNSVFVNNTAYNYGGAIASKSSTVVINKTRFNNDKSSNDAGGALYLLSSTFTGNDLNITNATACFGSAITSLSSKVTLNSLIALNNSAVYEGGAIYVMYGTFILTSSKFITNQARNGGALFIDNATSGSVKSNYFINNTAASYAGAIYAICNAFSVASNTYEDNSADYYDDLYESSAIDLFIGNGNYTLFKTNSSYNSTLPSYYSLVDDGYVTSVKNQEDGGNCWAFSALASLESCILKAGGTTFDFSEENMKNLMAVFSDYGWNIDTNDGGNFYMAIAYLASWLGPVYDSDDLYDGESTLSALLDSLMHVQNVLFLKRSSYTDNDEIKKAILSYGAVASSLYYNSNYLSSNKYYYYSGSSSSNHAVTIVGWDDSITISGYTGAWIVKNSWGSSWGNNGYFYVSYYDTSLAKVGSYDAYTFILNDTINYDKNYQYDIAGRTDTFTYKSTSSSVWYANIFNATDDEYLTAVSTYFEDSTDWYLEIYVDSSLKASKSGYSKAGYCTIPLDDFIEISKGSVFEVHFKISVNGTAVIPICKKDSINKVTFSSGISFVSSSGNKWTDLYAYSESSGHGPGSKKSYTYQVACIKAFTILNKINTTSSLNISYDDTFNITVKVLDQYGNLLNTGNVTFTVNNVDYTVSVTNGIASIVNILNQEENNISVHFDAVGYATSYYSTLIVRTSLQADDLTTYYMSGEEYSVYLSDVSGSSLYNRAVTFVLNNQTYTTYCDEDGKASFNVYLDCGDYNITIGYAGFNSSEINYFVTKNIYVVESDVNITVNITQIDDYALVYVNASLKINETVVICVNGVNSSYNMTYGYLLVNLTDLDYGNCTIFVFVGSYYASSGESFNVTVKRTVIFASDLTVYYGGDYYSVQLVDVYGDVLAGKEIIFTVGGENYTGTTDSSGYASLPVNLNVGSYNITVTFLGDDDYIKSTNSSTILVKSLTNVTYNITYTQIEDYVLIYVNASSDINETVVICVNGVNSSYNMTYGYLLVNLTDLDYGNCTIFVFIGSYYASSGESFNVTVKRTVIFASDLTVYYGGDYYSVQLVDVYGDVLAGKEIIFTVGGENYTSTTDSSGYASLPVNLNAGSYDITATFSGDDDYIKSANSSAILVKSSIILSNLKYTYNSKYYVTFLDSDGNALVNTQVSINLDGINYNLTTDSLGKAYITLKLSKGNYNSVISNLKTGEILTQTINVVSRITGNKALTFYYGANKYYRVRVCDDNGNFISGLKVTFKINKKQYTRITDSNGYASFKITLKSGKYTITASYNGFSVSNKIKIKSTLITKNKKVKKGKKIKYKAKLLNKKGKALKGKKITFKIKGKKYKTRTNKKGIAKITIKKSFKAGRYKITAKYKKLKSKSTITIKK